MGEERGDTERRETESHASGGADESGGEATAGFGESRRALARLGRALTREFGGALRAGRRRLAAAASRGKGTDRIVDEAVAPEPTALAGRAQMGGGVPLLAGFATALLIWTAATVAVAWWVLRDVPWRAIAEGTLAPVVQLVDADGEVIVHGGPYQGAHVSLDQYPSHLIDAVLAIEDRRFFEHRGIDLRGVARAAMRNVAAGHVREGGSTITQQLVKVLYLERDRTFRRKLQEMVIAPWLEARLGKEEILTRYLNAIYLGGGATGVPAAARVYFGKEVEALTLNEAAMIAGLIRAPSALNPRADPEAAHLRTEVVLEAMVAAGRLERGDADAARLETAQVVANPVASEAGSWFADWAMQEAREVAGPYRGTIRIQTTLVPAMQEVAEAVVVKTLADEGEAAGASQAAVVVMSPDGAVLAMVGGRDYGESSFNRAVSAMRQPGSTFKTFVYYAALRAGIHPLDIVVDAPIEVAGWAPENFGGRFLGRVTVADAFARSLNAATVAIAETVGIEAIVEAARELGLDAPLTRTPSLALGTSEVNLLDLTGAYASIRAGVAPVDPWGIASFSAEETGRAFRLGPVRRPDTDISDLQPHMVDLLRRVVEEGTGRSAAIDGFAAGKTGTSQNFRDAWFVGFTEHWVVGVWVGNDDGTSMNQVTGGGLPARIWRDVVTGANALMPDGRDPLGRERLDRPDTVPASPDAGDGALVAEAVPMCDVDACSRRFRSFRSADCTYQPYRGPRRMCEVGDVPTAAATVETRRTGLVAEREITGSIGAASAVSAAPACNVQACSRSYRSFRASDCTYQPYRGPRRMCER